MATIPPSGEVPPTGQIPPNRWAARFEKFAEIVSSAMFAFVFLIFNYKIITRYLEHNEAAWADEVSVILFIWIIFWANAFVLHDRQQIRFDLIYHPLPARIKRVMAIARLALVGGLFLWSAPVSIGYILFLWREKTPVLGLRLDYIYSCFGIFLIAVVVRSFGAIVGLLGPRWRTYI
jgi:TRAP-type C4-dicarboxylate transport system permease small subunit